MPAPTVRDCSPWARAALDREVAEVAATAEGERNDRLNAAAYSLGQIVGGGYLHESDVTAALATAAHRCGLPEHEAAATIASGLRAGGEHPRHPEERPATAKRLMRNDCPEPPPDDGPDHTDDDAPDAPPSEARAKVETVGGVFKPVETAPRAPLRVLSAAEVFSVELTAPAWVVRGLQIGPGRPTLFAGYSYSLKSLLALVTALGVASGQPLWGRFHVRRVRVLVLDFEGGDTVLRLRRLAVSMGLDFDDLVSGDWINVAPAPDRFLDDADAVAWLTEACAGFGLVVADSLRQAAPNADENSSEIGVTLAVPTRVSLATGCSFVLVAHSGKTSKDQTKDTRQTATRGSSAIFSQAGNVLHVDRDETRPGVHRVKQRKRPTGAWGPGVEPITVRVHDDDENSVTLLEHDQDDDGTDRLVPAKVPGLVLELLEEAEPGPAGVIGDTLEDLILAELKRRSPQSRRGLSGNLSRRQNAIGDAVKRLLTAGRVIETPQGLALPTTTTPDPWDEGFDHDL
jgi:hypothetical protein